MPNTPGLDTSLLHTKAMQNIFLKAIMSHLKQFFKLMAFKKKDLSHYKVCTLRTETVQCLVISVILDAQEKQVWGVAEQEHPAHRGN